MTKALKFLLPAGLYYVGDPCYVISRERWGAFLDAVGAMDNSWEGGVAILDDHPAVVFHTAHGDGTYCDEAGRMYPVDAGMIGAVSVKLARVDVWTKGVHLFEFKRLTVCTRSARGILKFGPTKIDTGV